MVGAMVDAVVDVAMVDLMVDAIFDAMVDAMVGGAPSARHILGRECLPGMAQYSAPIAPRLPTVPYRRLPPEKSRNRCHGRRYRLPKQN